MYFPHLSGKYCGNVELPTRTSHISSPDGSIFGCGHRSKVLKFIIISCVANLSHFCRISRTFGPGKIEIASAMLTVSAHDLC